MPDCESDPFDLRDLLKVVWPTFGEIQWGWRRDDTSAFFERDLPTEEAAKGYGERNRARICSSLVEGIRQVEKEIEEANANINEVFDFRLITDSPIRGSYSNDREAFTVVSAEKHRLVASPVLSSYDRNIEKIRPYTITVTQQGYQLVMECHRFTYQARVLKDEVNRIFTTSFTAIEADTQQEIVSR